MVSMYCKANHTERYIEKNRVCRDCFEVEQYSLSKLETCPFGSRKPNCPKCPVHCYSKEMRERISTIMRYSGPRMVFKHPVLSSYHMLNSLRKSDHVKLKL